MSQNTSHKTNPFGLRPVYYHSGSLKTILLDELLDLRASAAIHPHALLHYYCFGFEPSGQTLLENIHKLPAGCELNQQNNSVSENYSLASAFFQSNLMNLSENEYIKRIDAALAQHIKNTASSELNAVSLSGGVDSGYVAVKLAQNHIPFKAYTLLYGNAYNETDRIKVLEKQLGFTTHQLRLSPEEILKNFEQVNANSGSPVGCNNATMNFIFKQAVADGVKHIYDGDGADRLFLGMNRYVQYQKMLRLYQTAHTLGLKRMLPIIEKIPGKEFKKMAHHFQNWNAGLLPYFERVNDKAYAYQADFEDRLYTMAVEPYWQKFHNAHPQYNLWNDPFAFLTYFSISKCPEMFFHQPAEMQARLGMKAIPAFWGDELVQLAVNIPTSLKLRGKTTKYILRKAAAQNIAPEYWKLPKIGLQNAFQFAIQSVYGREWLKNMHDEMPKTDWFRQLQQMLPNKITDLNRLMPLHLWFRGTTKHNSRSFV